MSYQPKGSYLLGDVVVDFDTNRLKTPNSELKLPPRPMAVLYLLLETPGAPVSREALIEKVWEGNGYVGKRGVTDAIWRLRKMLETYPTAGLAIETLPKTGYRLKGALDGIKPHETVTREISIPQPNSLPSPKKAAPKDGSQRIVFLLSLSLMIIAVAAWFLQKPSTVAPQRPMPLISNPVTFASGIEHYASLSPDGMMMTYAALSAPGKSRIMVRPLSDTAAKPRELDASPGFQSQPAWSPSGDHIAYVQLVSRRDAVLVITDLEGGNRQSFEDIGLRPNSALAWHPDGKSVTFSAYDSSTGIGGIAQLNLADGMRQFLTQAKVNIHFADHHPVWSPDGSQLAFLRTYGSGPFICIMDTTGQIRQMTQSYLRIWGIDWFPDSRQVVFAAPERAGADHHGVLWSLDLASGESARLGVTSESLHFPKVLPDGRKVVAYTAKPIRNISSLDLNHPNQAQSVPQIESTRTDQDADWSPTQQRLVFASTRSGSQELWQSDFNGGQLVQLTNFKRAAAFPRWSPDGKRVVFVAYDDQLQGRTCYLLEPSSKTVQPLGQEGAFYICPSWSRDGRYVYAARYEEGTFNLWRIRITDLHAEPITQSNGFYAQESSDGRTLFFTKVDEDGLWAMSLPNGNERQVVPWNGTYSISWLPTEDHVLFLDNNVEQPRILAFEYATEKVFIAKLLPKQAAISNRPWSLKADQNLLIVSQGVETEGDLHTISLVAP